MGLHDAHLKNEVPAWVILHLSPRNLEPLSTPAKISKNRVPLDIKNKSNAKTTGRKPASEEGEQREAMELPAE